MKTETRLIYYFVFSALTQQQKTVWKTPAANFRFFLLKSEISNFTVPVSAKDKAQPIC